MTSSLISRINHFRGIDNEYEKILHNDCKTAAPNVVIPELLCECISGNLSTSNLNSLIVFLLEYLTQNMKAVLK